jgi:hypothetical protein
MSQSTENLFAVLLTMALQYGERSLELFRLYRERRASGEGVTAADIAALRAQDVEAEQQLEADIERAEAEGR